MKLLTINELLEQYEAEQPDESFNEYVASYADYIESLHEGGDE